MNTNPVQIFIAHSIEDQNYLKELKIIINPLRINNNLSIWDCTLLLGGENIKKSIEMKLNESHLILFLVSANSINDDYMMEKIQIETQKGKVVPIILEDSLWEEYDFLSNLQCLPKEEASISGAKNKNKVYTAIAKEIKLIITKIRAENIKNNQIPRIIIKKTEKIKNATPSLTAKAYFEIGKKHKRDNNHIKAIDNFIKGVNEIEKSGKNLEILIRLYGFYRV